MEFKSSDFLSLGVELELQIVNKHNHDLTPRAAEFLRNFSHTSFSSQLKPEITQSMLEINSSVHRHPDTLLDELTTIRDMLSSTSNALNLLLIGGGAHPFQMWHDRRIYPDPHYLKTEKKYGYLAKMFTVFGMHIHLGCTDGDDAIYLMNALSRYIPHFIALSASSPYCQGTDTGFNSSRSNVVKMFPLSGLAPHVETWGEFCDWIENIKKLKIAENINNFYWDIRPKPNYGTVEIRVCDTPLTIERAVEIASFAQSLARYILMDRPSHSTHIEPLLADWNRHQASHMGFKADFIDPLNMDVISLKDDIIATITHLEPHSAALGTSIYLESIKKLVRHESNDAKTLRDYFNERQSMHDLVSHQSFLFSKNTTPLIEESFALVY